MYWLLRYDVKHKQLDALFLGASLMTEEKVFLTFTLGLNAIKLLTSLIYKDFNKLVECLFLVSFSA